MLSKIKSQLLCQLSYRGDQQAHRIAARKGKVKPSGRVSPRVQSLTKKPEMLGNVPFPCDRTALAANDSARIVLALNLLQMDNLNGMMSDAIDQLIVIGLILIVLWMLRSLADGTPSTNDSKRAEDPSPNSK